MRYISKSIFQNHEYMMNSSPFAVMTKTLSLPGVHSLSLFLTLPLCCCFCCSLLLRCSSLQCCASVAVAQSISILGRWVSAVLSLSLSPHPSPSHCELQVTQQTHKYKAMATCSCAIFTHSCYSNGSHLYIFPTSCCHSLLFLPISLFLPLSTVAVSVLWSRDGIT